MSAPAPTRPVAQTERDDYNDLLDKVISNTSSQIDSVAQQYSHAIKEAEGRMSRSMLLADGIDKIRAMLDDKIMARFLKLQGSQLGFLTDKDKEGGYQLPIVRDCLIDALLVGVFPVGNEFNIIAGKMYVTQAGYKRLVKEIPGVEILDDIPGTPTLDAGKMKVRYCLRWKKGGVVDELRDPDGNVGRLFVVKVNSGMGDDAIIGKACRKAFKAAYEKITGHATPDGEVEGEASDTTPTAPPTQRTNLRGNGNGQGKAEEKTAEDPPAAPSESAPDESEANWSDFTRDYDAAVKRGDPSDAGNIIDQWHATFAEHPKYKDQLAERMKHVQGMHQQKAAQTAAAPVAGGTKGKSKLF